MSAVDGRGRPRDYNAVARHRDLLEGSIELAVPKLERALAHLRQITPYSTFEDQELIHKAIHDLTVGTE
jgi:hypothetical protein